MDFTINKSKSLILLFFAMLALISIILLNNGGYLFSEKIIYHDPSYVADFSNASNLVGFSDNVFIGQVVSSAGNKSLSKHPETQYNVEVLTNIKGELKGTVVINHEAGYKDSNLHLMMDDTLIQEGKTYLFATRFNKQENWYTVVPVYGKVILNTDEEKDNKLETMKNALNTQIKFNF